MIPCVGFSSIPQICPMDGAGAFGRKVAITRERARLDDHTTKLGNCRMMPEMAKSGIHEKLSGIGWRRRWSGGTNFVVV